MDGITKAKIKRLSNKKGLLVSDNWNKTLLKSSNKRIRSCADVLINATFFCLAVLASGALCQTRMKMINPIQSLKNWLSQSDKQDIDLHPRLPMYDHLYVVYESILKSRDPF